MTHCFLLSTYFARSFVECVARFHTISVCWRPSPLAFSLLFLSQLHLINIFCFCFFSFAQVLNSSSTSSTKSSTTTSRVAKTSSSQRLHHVSSSTSSSSSSTSEIKAMALKRDLNDMKNSMSELVTISRTQPTIASEMKLTNPSALSQLQMRLRSSLENIVDEDDTEPLVTFPDADETPTSELELELHATQLPCVATGDLSITDNHLNTTTDTVKFEEKRMVSASKTKVIKDGFSSVQVCVAHHSTC